MLANAGVVVFIVAVLHATLPSNPGLDIVRDVIGALSLVIVALCLVIGGLAFSPLSLGFKELPKGKPRRGILNERYSKKKALDGKYDAIIIGSGMGGLSCAASLARFGKRCLVLEQHDVAGGGTHTFVIDGKTDYNFDSGLHYTVPQSGELLQLACGTRNKPVEFDKLGEEDGCFDRIVLGDYKDEGLRVKHEQAHFEQIRKMFPEERDQKEMKEFLDLSTKINNLIPLWMISKVFPSWARKLWKKLVLGTFTEYAKQTGEEVTDKMISNKKLGAILNGMWMDSGSPPYECTFMMTAALTVGFPKEGGAYPTGGSELMATCLIQAIEEAGGKVLMRARVNEIMVEANKVKGVRLMDDTEVECPLVISACGYGNTYMKLLKEAPKGYTSMEKGADGESRKCLPSPLRNSSSWVMANVGIRASPEEFGIGCSNVWVHPCYEEDDYDLMKGVKDYFENPLDCKTLPMMITFPSIKDRACKDGENGRMTCQLLALAKEEWFSKWYSENGKHPEGGEYNQLKKKWEDKLMEGLVTRFPGIKEKVDFVDLSTPLSITYYLNKSGAGAVGLDLNPERFYDERTEDLLDMKSPIDGLWLTGEDTLLCGQPLAQLSGILTSWRIMGLSGSVSFLLGIFRLAISDLLGL